MFEIVKYRREVIGFVMNNQEVESPQIVGMSVTSRAVSTFLETHNMK